MQECVTASSSRAQERYDRLATSEISACLFSFNCRLHFGRVRADCPRARRPSSLNSCDRSGPVDLCRQLQWSKHHSKWPWPQHDHDASLLQILPCASRLLRQKVVGKGPRRRLGGSESPRVGGRVCVVLVYFFSRRPDDLCDTLLVNIGKTNQRGVGGWGFRRLQGAKME